MNKSNFLIKEYYPTFFYENSGSIIYKVYFIDKNVEMQELINKKECK